MKKRIIFIIAAFFAVTGFSGDDRIVEESSVNFQERSALEESAPKILKPLKNNQVPEGHYVTFVVEFAPSNCDIVWINNVGNVIPHGGRFLLSKNGSTAKLTIKELVPSDGGKYEVRISNKRGVVVSSADLFIILADQGEK